MRTTNKILFFSILIFLIAACSGGNKEQQSGVDQDQLYDQVMEIHDEVMPKMGDLMNYQSELKNRIDSLQQAEAGGIDPLQATVDELEEAHDAMMNWMRNFKRDYEGMSDQEVIEYLQAEKNKMQQVKEQMNQALTEAQQVL